MSWLGFPNLNQYCQSPPERCWFQPLACYSFHHFSWPVAIGIVSSDVETCCTFWWMDGTVWHQSKSSYAKSTAVGRRSSQCLLVNFPNRLRIENLSQISCSYPIIFMLVRLHPPLSQPYSFATTGSVSHKPTRANPEIGKRAATLSIFHK